MQTSSTELQNKIYITELPGEGHHTAKQIHTQPKYSTEDLLNWFLKEKYLAGLKYDVSSLKSF
jgi:hypothetical protein